MIAEILDVLYDNFVTDEGVEDYCLSPGNENVRHRYAAQAEYWADVADAQVKVNGAADLSVALDAALFAALAEPDPNLKSDALLRLAATAIAAAASVQRQVEDEDEVVDESEEE